MRQSQLLGLFQKKKKQQTIKQTRGVLSSIGKIRKVAIALIDLERLVPVVVKEAIRKSKKQNQKWIRV